MTPTNPSRPDAEALLASASFLRRVAFDLVRDEHMAEDLAQEAFAVALAHQGCPPRNLRAWLMGVTRNLARMSVRAKTRRAAREARVAAHRAPPDDPATVAAELEIHREIVNAVFALNEPYRSMIVYRYFRDLAPTEIARQLGIPRETVRTRLGRALAILRARLDTHHDRAEWTSLLLPLVVPRTGPGWAGPLLRSLFMTTKAKLTLVAASFLGIVLGAAGTAVILTSPTPHGPPPSAAISRGEVGDLRADRDRLESENHRLSAELKSTRRTLTAKSRELAARIHSMKATVAPSSPAPAKAATRAAKDALAGIDWDRWMPVLVELAAHDPLSGKPMPAKLQEQAVKLMDAISSRLGGTPGEDAADLWGSPLVGSRIAGAASAHFHEGLGANRRHDLETALRKALAKIDDHAPKQPLEMEQFALVLEKLARAEESVNRFVDPSTAAKVVSLLRGLWPKAGWLPLYLGAVTRDEFVASELQFWGVRATLVEEDRKAASRILRAWWDDYRRTADQLSASYGRDAVEAALTDPREATGQAREERARPEFPGTEIHVLAQLAEVQARAERKFKKLYDTLPADLKRGFDRVEPTLDLFRPK